MTKELEWNRNSLVYTEMIIRIGKVWNITEGLTE